MDISYVGRSGFREQRPIKLVQMVNSTELPFTRTQTLNLSINMDFTKRFTDKSPFLEGDVNTNAHTM
jgi:hypothetical protein